MMMSVDTAGDGTQHAFEASLGLILTPFPELGGTLGYTGCQNSPYRPLNGLKPHVQATAMDQGHF